MNRRHALRTLLFTLTLMPAAALAQRTGAADPAGTYDLVLHAASRTEPAVLVLERSGTASLTGTLTLHGQPFPLENVVFDAAKNTVAMSVAHGHLKLTLTFQGERVSGSALAHDEAGTVTGTRRRQASGDTR